METAPAQIVERVNQLFGSYKAEWLEEHLFEFFTEPAYFNELKTNRPCVLIGGRGTGKTTVLRGLSYLGQFAISGNNAASISNWPFFGLYYRVNTNRVTAFRGPELTEDQWTRAFAHYLNLVLLHLVLEFVEWYERQTAIPVILPTDAVEVIGRSMHLSDTRDIKVLSTKITYAITEFEAQINNIVDEPLSHLSMQAAPVDLLVTALARTDALKGKHLYFLIDEFENFLDYQQRVINTIVKHASSASRYSFKLGVRELGWRERSTLNPNEVMTHPADYVRLDVHEMMDRERFRGFAERVLDGRLVKIREEGHSSLKKISTFFPGLSEEDEVALLAGEHYKEALLAEESAKLSKDLMKAAQALSVSQIHFLKFWVSTEKKEFSEVLTDYLKSPDRWNERFVNHFYASLFAIRAGKRGVRKYYAGWDVFLSLADGNIRYLMELVHTSLLNHFANEGSLSESISPQQQTEAAQAVGRKNLAELEGLTVEGARLTKLLLGLGRVFQVMAADPAGHTPEVNQFHVPPSESDTAEDSRQVKQLLELAVMHLALVRAPGNKLADVTDTREYDYMIHPIYAAFFVFSHRRKRKCSLTASHLIGLVERPRATIKDILSRNNRQEASDKLPDQLALFQEFYAGD